MDDTKKILKQYILDEFLYGEDPGSLHTDTPLISGGVLDSLTTLRLVQFIEQTFGVELEAFEAGVDYLDTIDDMASLIHAKKSA